GTGGTAGERIARERRDFRITSAPSGEGALLPVLESAQRVAAGTPAAWASGGSVSRCPSSAVAS
ncbi:hypothetical protein, partial [Streptomyces sp.]|uniref:hypothetical protein n=1 Tax=Streptomyces sp. TaxID=1931 RepID=UPI002810CB05